MTRTIPRMIALSERGVGVAVTGASDPVQAAREVLQDIANVI